MAKKEEEKGRDAEEPIDDEEAEAEAEEEEEEGDDDEGDEDDDAEESDDDDSDDEDEDDDDFEHEDDDAPAASARAIGDAAAPPPEPQDPTWWVPHAVLGALVVVGVLGFFGAFNRFLRPLFHKVDVVETTAEHAPTKPASTASPTGAPMAPANKGDMYGAKHLVVQYKGSARAPATVTRSKEEAKARADEALKKIKAGSKFEEVVGDYSDEPGAKDRGGDLGKFRKGTFDPKFVEAVEKLKVGDVSDVVETPFGYHVILRTQ